MVPLWLEPLEPRCLLASTLQAISLPAANQPSSDTAAGISSNPSVSADGRYVAYTSTAPNLVAGQNNGPITSNVFLFDRTLQTTLLVSQAAGAATPTGGNADSFDAILSRNGRSLFYLSDASNLVTGQSGPATENLFVYDTVAQTTRLVTGHLGSTSQPTDGNTGVLSPSLSTGAPFTVSADGTRVAYVSAADDLVSGLTGLLGAAHPNVFLANVSNPTTVTTVLVSHQATSFTVGAGGRAPALSADGSTVAFVSDGTNLVASQVEQPQPPGTTLYSAVFLYNGGTQANLLVSRKYGTTVTVASATSDTPVINQDGSVVAFRSDAADLVAQQFPGSPPGNVFIYERSVDTVGLVSHVPQELTVATGGTPFTPDSQGALPLGISANGQALVYQSQAANLVGAASAPGSNVFLWTLTSVSPGFAVAGNNFLVSGAGGAPAMPANGSSLAPVLSNDASTIAFESTATNLVPGQASTGSTLNVFTASTVAVLGGQNQPPTLVSSANGSTRVAANADSSGGVRSQGTSTTLFPGSAGLSSDGSIVLFQSSATNLSTSIFKATSGTDVFAYDANAGALTLVSQSAAPVATAGGNSYIASVSADDSLTVFVSDAFNLVANQQNNHFGLNVFLRNNTTQGVTLVNHVPAPGAPTATGDSGLPEPPFTPTPGQPVPPPPAGVVMPVVSGDDSTVVFVSNDHDLVSGQSSSGRFNNVFLYKLASGGIVLVSHLPNQGTVSGAYDSNSPAVNFTGEFVAFVSTGGVYLYDASAPATLTQIAASGASPSISDSGQYVTYVSQGNAFLYNRLTGTSTLISHDASSTKGELLALTAPPATITAGTAFALTATVQDAVGNTDTTFNGTVTLALGPSSPPGATLGGTTSAQATSGVAHFTSVLLTVAGTGYALTASASGVTPALTAAFTVVPAAASQLGFLPPPSLSLVNEPLAPTAAVAVEDANGNVVNSSASVTVALGSSPMGAILSGTTTVTAVNGVATFNRLTVNLAGTYTLTASANGFPVTTSPSFGVTSLVAGLVITTVAGNGTEGFGGDGGPATAAVLNFPQFVAVDAGVNFYFSDSNDRVRKVSADGTISTVAGNGAPGYSGDGGPATAAQLGSAQGLAVDAAGNLYIADFGNNRIRKVSPSGIITTVAGNGTAGFSGDGGTATAAELDQPYDVAVDAAGNLYIADTYNYRIRKVSPNGIITTLAGNGTSGDSGDGGPATAAEFSYPSGVAVDANGNVLIADNGANRVRKVAPSGIISTVAGTGTAGFSGDGGPATAAQLFEPSTVTLDAAGNLYIADYGDYRIRKVTPGGTISTVAGRGGQNGSFGGDGGPAAAAGLNAAFGVAADAAGNLYIADAGNNRIRKVAPTATRFALQTAPPTSVPAGGSFTAAIAVQDGNGNTLSGFGGSVSVALDPTSPAGAVLGGTTTVTAVNGIATFTLSQTRAGFSTLDFTAPSAVGTTGQVTVQPLAASALGFGQQPTNTVIGQAISPAVTVQIRDRYGNVVANASPITLALGDNLTGATLGGTTTVTASGGQATFGDLTLDRAGTYTLVATAGTLASATSMPFSATTRLAVPTVSTVAGNGTKGYSGDGGPATAAEFMYPGGLAVDAAGNLYIADYFGQRIRKVSPSGTITTVAGNGTAGFSGDGGPATAAQLSYPTAVAVDAAGNLYIADYSNSRIREVSPAGVITTVAGNGSLSFGGDGGPATSALLNGPEGVAVDAAGNLYIADTGNQRIRKVSAGGTISTVAGNGSQGDSGDGGPATSAQLSNPSQVAVDAAGNLYVLDANGQRVRKVSPSGIITAAAGNGTVGSGGDGGPATAAQFFGAAAVAVDAAGNLYIADYGNNRIRKVSPSGVITTAAGTGSDGFGGDGGPATAALLFGPSGVAADGRGNVFVADTFNYRVREVINPAAKLAITTAPPASVAAGAPFEVAVSVEDPSGNAVSDYTGTVTLTLGNHPGGATLGGPTTALIDPDNGVATFTGLTIGQVGTGYTLVATSAGLTSATTAGFNVAGVTATLLAVTSLPSPLTAGIPFTLQIAAQDAFGHTDSTYTGQVTLSLPSGTVNTNAQAGVATFSNLTISQPAKNVTLSASAPGLTGVTTAPFNVGAAAATQLVLSQPAGVKAGVPFTFTVTAEDGSGNVATAFKGAVTVALGTNPTGATLAGNTLVNAVNGIATFALGVSQPGTGYTLTANTATLPLVATNPFNVAATPELLAITPPASVTAGSALSVTVTAESAAGTVDSSFNGNVTLAVGPGSPADTFLGTTASGATTVTAVNGVATFTGLLLTQAGSYTLTAATAHFTGGFSTPFPVNAAAATQLVLTPPTTATAGNAFTVTVAVQDGLGNTVLSFNGSVSVTLGNNPNGATLSGTTPVNAVKGIATLSLTLNKSGVGYTLSASAPGLPAAASTPFNVGGITTTQLGVAEQAFVLANVPFAVSVAAQDSSGNLVPSFNGLITLTLGPTSPAGAVLGGSLTAQAVNGVATFTGLTLATPGTGYTLVASAGTPSGTAPHPLTVLGGGNAGSSYPVVSAQGNAVAYVSAASNLVAGQGATGFTNILLCSVSAATNVLLSGSLARPANGNSDSPAIDMDGSYVAYRSDASNLVNNQAGSNIYEVNTSTGAQTLVSHQAGASTTAATGASSEPVIDGDGHLVAYVSTAGNLVPGQSGPAGITNIFIWLRQTDANILASGQDGSATVTGNADSDGPVLSRDSFPGFSSVATNLVASAGATSVAYLNTLVQLVLSNNILADQSPAGTTVGNLTITGSLYAGAYLPPSYSLPGGEANNAAFTLGSNASGEALFTFAPTNYAVQPSYQVNVHVDIGFGDEAALFPIAVAAPPSVTINQAAGQADPTNAATINFTVIFNQPVSNFGTGDVGLAGTAGASSALVTGSGTTYNVAVSGMTQTGTVVATVPAGVATSAAGSPNLASTSTDNLVTYDVTRPTVTINQAAGQADPTNVAPLHFTVVFSKPVFFFATGDVTLDGTAGATTALVTGSGTTYTVAVSGMTGSGTVTATLAAGVAQDAAGNLNLASTSTDNTVTYDVTPPTVTINQATGQADPTNTGPINFTVVFSKPMSNFGTGDVGLAGTAGASSAIVSGSGTTYNVAVSGMTHTGTVIATIPAGVAHDLVGNFNLASTSTDNTVTYDVTPPTATVNPAAGQPTLTNVSPIHFTVVFSKPVSTFTSADVTLSGTAGANTPVVSGSGTTYAVQVSAAHNGTVIVSVPAGVVHDAAGNANTASNSSTVTYDTQAASASLGPVSSPRQSALASETIVFSAPVPGLTLADLSLSQGGSANLLTAAQTLTTSDNLTWTLGNLATLTNPAGRVAGFTLTLTTASLTDQAGNPVVGPITTSFVVVDATLMLQGTTLTVPGTAGNDTFTFTAGPGEQASLNGVSYTIDPTTVSTVQFQGNGGSDSATLNAAGAYSTAQLSLGAGTLSGSVGGKPYAVSVSSVTTLTVNAGSAIDYAGFTDSSGGSIYIGAPAFSKLTRGAQLTLAAGFAYAAASGTSGDTAYLVQAVGQYLAATHDYSLLRTYTNPIAANEVVGFSTVIAYAAGHSDSAYLFSSSGSNHFIATPTTVDLVTGGVVNEARGFQYVVATSSSGNDGATFADTAGSNTYIGTPAYSYLVNGQTKALQEAIGFAFVYAASGGGDVATLLDPTGKGGLNFLGTPAASLLRAGSTILNEVVGFPSVTAQVTAGGTEYATLYDAPGVATVLGGGPGDTFVRGGAYYANAVGFALVSAYATAGNQDTGYLSDDALGGTLVGQGTSAVLEGPPGYSVALYGFSSVIAIGSTGSNKLSLAAIDYFFSDIGTWTPV